MDDKVLIAIISATSALVGSLIPTIFNFLNNKTQNGFTLKRDLLENQKNVYWVIMIALQNIINKNGENEFLELQKAAIKLSIYGDNNSSKAINNYYNELVKSAQGTRDLLTSDEHRNFQKSIINGMRNNLGLDEFESFEIVGYRPKN